ncbi:MAG: HEAT repeat domain-containing protein [Planctomycetes bacterium]|nr:HEAT repeat domain-containing protein [Planctomycetota bacterium]
MSRSGVDIREMIATEPVRSLVLSGRESVRPLLHFASSERDRLAAAAAIYALGEIRDPRACDDLEKLRQEAGDPFVKDAAEGALAKILWWRSTAAVRPEVPSQPPLQKEPAVSEEWRSAMRSRLVLSEAQTLALIEGTHQRRTLAEGDCHLDERQVALFLDNWDVSREIVLSRLSESQAPWEDETVSELAVLALAPIEELRGDSRLRPALRRFASSSENEVRVVALLGLLRLGDPYAVSSAAAMAREFRDEALGRLFRAIQDDPAAATFCDLRDTYHRFTFNVAYRPPPGWNEDADDESEESKVDPIAAPGTESSAAIRSVGVDSAYPVHMGIGAPSPALEVRVRPPSVPPPESSMDDVDNFRLLFALVAAVLLVVGLVLRTKRSSSL